MPKTAILSPRNRDVVTVLYVESLIVEGSVFKQGRAVEEVLRQLLGGALAPICDLNKIQTICAIAASSLGDGIMIDALNFTIEQAGHLRKDEHHFYTVSFADLVKEAQPYLRRVA